MDGVKQIAGELQIDTAAFDLCIDERKHAKRIEDERAAGTALGVNATPSIFVQDERLPGVPAYEQMQQAIHAATR